MPRGLQKFSFLTRDKTQAPAVEAQIFNNWAAREVCPLYCKEHLFSNKKGSQEGRRGREETGDRTSGVKITLKVDIHTATWQELRLN